MSPVEALNARFRRLPYDVRGWEHLADAGVLAHTFDGWENNGKLWTPKVHGACPDCTPPIGVPINMSTSLIHRGMYPGRPSAASVALTLFNAPAAGLIFRPGYTNLACGNAKDAGGHCHDFCPSPELLQNGTPVRNFDSLGFPGDGCGGPSNHGKGAGTSWRPCDFGKFLYLTARFIQDKDRVFYNEFILPGRAWVDNLPHVIDAFFSPSCGDSNTVKARNDFLRHFPTASGADYPHVRFDFNNWDNPFFLCPDQQWWHR